MKMNRKQQIKPIELSIKHRKRKFDLDSQMKMNDSKTKLLNRVPSNIDLVLDIGKSSLNNPMN